MSDERVDAETPSGPVPTQRSSENDLAAIEADLADIETALDRLDTGTYWIDEVTGEALPDELLEQNPLLRRRP